MRINRANIKRFFKRPAKTGLIFIVLLVLLGGGYWHFVHKTVRVVQLPAKTTTEKISTPSSAASSAPSQKAASPQGGSAASAAPTDVTAPSGSFVSNHQPSTTADQEQSLCSTTIGAKCSISFTKGSSVIKLEAQQTDDNGSTTWDWTPSQLGLSSGSWSVSATATAGSNSATTTDPRALDIP